MAYRMAVCDDNATDVSFVEEMVQEWAEHQKTSVRLETFPSAEAFLFQYSQDQDYDVLLLDIEMGRMDGVTLAKTIRKENESVQIVFVTGYSDYILEGYEVAALHYLVKPVNREKLFSVLDRAVERCRRNEKSLVLESAGETVRLPLRTIRYLEVRQNYVTVHAKADHTVKKPLAEFESMLDETFFRTGRSFIVNLSWIQRVTRREIHLSSGESIPLPRGMYDAINRAIIERT